MSLLTRKLLAHRKNSIFSSDRTLDRGKICRTRQQQSASDVRMTMRTLVPLVLLFLKLACLSANPFVTLPDGTRLQGIKDGSVSAFRGIRFALPPLNSLRWAPPRPWVNLNLSEVVDATAFGHTCKQVLWGDDGLFSSDHGNEDCLFLNVYVNLDSLNSRSKNKLLPVGVFVHGGSYVTGASSLPLYDGVDAVEFWKGQAIIVTTNYRLNVFGFLGSEELRSQDSNYGSTGNQGISILTWKQESIGF